MKRIWQRITKKGLKVCVRMHHRNSPMYNFKRRLTLNTPNNLGKWYHHDQPNETQCPARHQDLADVGVAVTAAVPHCGVVVCGVPLWCGGDLTLHSVHTAVWCWPLTLMGVEGLHCNELSQLQCAFTLWGESWNGLRGEFWNIWGESWNTAWGRVSTDPYNKPLQWRRSS